MSIISKAEVTLQSTLLSNSEWEIVYPIDDRIVHRWKFSSSELGVSAIFKGRKSHELKYSCYLLGCPVLCSNFRVKKKLVLLLTL